MGQRKNDIQNESMTCNNPNGVVFLYSHKICAYMNYVEIEAEYFNNRQESYSIVIVPWWFELNALF